VVDSRIVARASHPWWRVASWHGRPTRGGESHRGTGVPPVVDSPTASWHGRSARGGESMAATAMPRMKIGATSLDSRLHDGMEGLRRYDDFG
jgi:hypothetical protein